jgi:hypothetical protein
MQYALRLTVTSQDVCIASLLRGIEALYVVNFNTSIFVVFHGVNLVETF